MSYAFISHAVKADGAFAMRLASDLRARSVRIWKAPESIKPGERWAEAIEAAVETCDTMLTVLTPEAVDSRWVSTEMNMAIEREHEGKMTVVPLDLRPCKVPRMWAQYQRIPFRGSYDVGLKELLEKLGVSSSPKTIAANPFGLSTGWDFKWEPDAKDESKETSEVSDIAKWKFPVAAAPTTAKPNKPWEKYLNLPEERNPWLASRSSLLTFVPHEVASSDSAGDQARQSFKYRDAIEQYTKAIESYEQNALLLSIDRHKKALGAIYYKRGQCWMSLDLWTSLGKVEKTPAAGFLQAKPKKLYETSPLTTYNFGKLFPSLLQVQEEYTKAQADFAKAKELGYEPPTAIKKLY